MNGKEMKDTRASSGAFPAAASTSSPSISLPTLKTGLVLRHPEPLSGACYSAVELLPDDRGVLLLDQRRLPDAEVYLLLVDVEAVADAIRTLAVRGAPAIGVAAGYAMVIAARKAPRDEGGFVRAMDAARALLAATRPTAVNLAWALARMARRARSVASFAAPERLAAMASEARAIHVEDVASCRAMGALGAAFVPDGARVLTYCNAGALATGGYGTALGVLRAARAQGKSIEVFAAETRPLLQGARLTAWELAKDGFDVTVLADGMVGKLMADGRVDLVVVGADRIARTGDVANKIGTYGVACLAHAHGLPFYVAAPWSTVDLACPDGASIPIETRAPQEVLTVPTPDGAVASAPLGVAAYNPAFDVTPARLVRALFTERGVVSPVAPDTLAALAPPS